MAIVDVSNRPWVVEIVPDNVVAEFTDASTTVEVPNGTPLVEFRCCESGGGGAGGALQFQDEGINLGANDSDTLNFVGGLVEATRAGNTVTATIAAASNAETNAGVLATKGVTPESGAYAYDRLHFPGQHDAGKATECITLTPVAGVVTIDALLSNVFRIVLTQNVTFAKPINLLLGQVLKLTIEQDDVGGWTGTFHPDIKFPFGLDPVVSTAPNAMDLVSILHDEATGLLLGSYMPDYTGTGTGWGIMVPGPPGPAGPPGAPGSVGPTGPAGTPAGGLTGQVLMKTTDDDYDADWASIGGLTLSGLGDVDVTGLIDGQALIWDSTLSEWVPGAAGDVATDAIWDAKGDLAVGSALDTAVRLPVGTDGQVLAANSAEATGLEWIDPPAGGGGGTTGGAMVFVAEAEVTGAAASTLVVNGLDLDADGIYIAILRVKSATASAVTLALFYNADTTPTNYFSSIASNGASTQANNANLTGMFASTESEALIHLTIGRAVSRVIATGIPALGTNSSANTRSQTNTHQWTTTGVNVTSLTINSSVASGLAIGSKIQIYKLTADVGASGAEVTRSTTQAFSSGVDADVIFDTEERDTDGYWNALNPERFTIPADGFYTISGYFRYNAGESGGITIGKNGSPELVGNSATSTFACDTAYTGYFVAGDYVTLRGGSSTASTILAGARFSIVRLTGVRGPQGIPGPVGISTDEMLAWQEDDFVVTSNASFQDTDLVLYLEPGTYVVEVETMLRSHVTPGALLQLAFSGTVGWAWSKRYGGEAGTTWGGQVVTGLPHSTAAQNYTNEGGHRWAGAVNVTVAGNLSVQFKQNTSNANAVTFRKGSYLRVKDVTDTNTTDIDVAVAADTPRAYWKFDEASGNFADSSGNGYTATVSGVAVTQYQFSALVPQFPSRKAAYIGGASQNTNRVTPGTLGLTAPLLDWTYEFFGVVATNGTMAGYGADGETAATNAAYIIDVNSTGTVQVFWEYGAGTNSPIFTSLLGGLLDGRKHHLVITKNSTTRTVAIYIDGSYAGGGTYTAGQEATDGTSGVLDLGASRMTAGAGCDGIYAVVAIYTAALSEARIQAHARALGVFS